MNKVKSLKEQMLEARKKSISLFADISHRLELVALKKGVEWINDSKATDLDSTHYSIELMEKPVVWIASSSDVELPYAMLEKLVKYKVKRIICFGDYETNLKYTFANMVDGYAHKSSLADAIETAERWAESGDVVLFSPATASHDLYEDYRERGEHFRALVKRLAD